MRARDMDRRQATVDAADRRRVLHVAAAMSAVAAGGPRGPMKGAPPTPAVKRPRRNPRGVLHVAAAMSAVAAVDPRGQVNGSYQPRSIKRQRRTASAVEQLERQILAILEEDHPQSIRHCFYRLTDPRLPEPVEKSVRLPA